MAGWDCYLSKSGEQGLNLVIAGGGPLEDEMAAWASARPSVEMIGTVNGDRCAELISHARAVLLPSAWEETFGLVAVEAMAAGVPPIAAGHGSFTELITPGVDGVLFSPGDPAALAHAIADVETTLSGTRLTVIRHARPTSSGSTHSATSRNCSEIYRFAITHPEQGPSRFPWCCRRSWEHVALASGTAVAAG